MCVKVFFIVRFGPGLGSMSPARSWNVVGSHDWHPEKTGGSGLRRGRIGGYALHSPTPPPPRM